MGEKENQPLHPTGAASKDLAPLAVPTNSSLLLTSSGTAFTQDDWDSVPLGRQAGVRAVRKGGSGILETKEPLASGTGSRTAGSGFNSGLCLGLTGS